MSLPLGNRLWLDLEGVTGFLLRLLPFLPLQLHQPLGLLTRGEVLLSRGRKVTLGPQAEEVPLERCTGLAKREFSGGGGGGEAEQNPKQESGGSERAGSQLLPL